MQHHPSWAEPNLHGEKRNPGPAKVGLRPTRATPASRAQVL